jgi:phosphoribosylaminoimidazole-succinocarboxamide synthase
LILIDEVLTPDSSRFWPADQYRARQRPAELRQAIRPRLPRNARLGQNPARPEMLPDDVVAKTSAKYLEAYEVHCGGIP